MTTTFTKSESYHAITSAEKTTKQQQVLKAIEATGPISDRKLALHLGWYRNSVIPRRNELWAKGLIQEAGTEWDEQSERNVTLWAIVPIMRDESHRNDFNRPGLPPILNADMASTPSNDATHSQDTKTALRASRTFSGDLPQKREIPLGQRLWFADRAAREAGLENYWIELYRLVAVATNGRELAYAFEIIAGYKANAVKAGTEEYVRKEYLIIKDLATWKQKELKNEMR